MSNLDPFVIFYFIGACAIILTGLFMYSVERPKDSGEKCECCGNALTDQEYFASQKCGHCLLAIKRLSPEAPKGYEPIRVRQLKKGQYFRHPSLCQQDLLVTDIRTKINCTGTWGQQGQRESNGQRYQLGINDQSWCWLWTGKK